MKKVEKTGLRKKGLKRRQNGTNRRNVQGGQTKSGSQSNKHLPSSGERSVCLQHPIHPDNIEHIMLSMVRLNGDTLALFFPESHRPYAASFDFLCFHF